MSRPSRLWKRLGATAPLFRVWNEDGLSLNDHTIKDIKISRGSDSAEDGIFTPTMSVESTVLENVRAGERIRVDLTGHGTQRLAAMCGADAATVRRRFYGRIGRQTVNDMEPGKQHTTFTAASWEAQLKNVNTKRMTYANESIIDVIHRLCWAQTAGLPWLPPWEAPASADQYGYVVSTTVPDNLQTYPNDIDKWTKDLGLYIQTRRDGSNYILTHQYRWDQALALLGSGNHHPITRSNAISPATWEQPAENMPVRHRVFWNDSNGPTFFTWGLDEGNENIPLTEYDMKHVRWAGNQNQPMQTGRAYFHRNVPPRYGLPALTFDVLRLANSKHLSHRDQAKQLLELEVGDPIFLSNDWYQQLRGVMFVVGLEESITPDGWDITLNLGNSREVVGEVTPEIPGRTWESANYQWNNQPNPNTKWKDS